MSQAPAVRQGLVVLMMSRPLTEVTDQWQGPIASSTDPELPVR
jgi:hypothetical protein